MGYTDYKVRHKQRDHNMEYWQMLATGALQRYQRRRQAKKAQKAGATKSQMTIEDIWRTTLEKGPAREHRHVIGRIPSKSRCKLCNAPFDGVGGIVFRMLGSGRSTMNPAWCKSCMENTPAGGAEIDLTLLFADIRGSTSIAEGMSPTEYVKLLNRFYAVSTNVMVKTDALIDKFVGDEVIGLYVPGFAGDDHPNLAIQAAQELLQATGHNDEPWVPVGAGIHTGRAFVGKVGNEDGVTDITALGDAVNVTARLASQAKAGEILVSEDTSSAAKLSTDNLEKRSLELKGKSNLVNVHVLKTKSAE